MGVNIDWKEKNEKYLNAMQVALDKIDNVENEELRIEIIGKMLKCDQILTELAIDEINKNKNCKNNK